MVLLQKITTVPVIVILTKKLHGLVEVLVVRQRLLPNHAVLANSDCKLQIEFISTCTPHISTASI